MKIQMATKPTGNKSQGDFTHTIFKQMVNLKYQLAEKTQYGTHAKKASTKKTTVEKR